jgi:septum formation protein
MTSTRIILASASPRRRELLGQLGLAFEVVVSGLDERPWPREMPASYALRNAADKAREVAQRVDGQGDTLIIAADTIVVVDDQILEKPVDAAHAVEMLRRLSGRWHEVMTGLCVGHRTRDGFHEQADAVRTGVRFRELAEREIAEYVATGEPMDKAGAYAIQGGAAGFVAETRGSYTNVVGLPMEALRRMLAACGLRV